MKKNTVDQKFIIDIVKRDFKINISNVEMIHYSSNNQVYSASYNKKTIFIRLNQKKRVHIIEMACANLLKKYKIPTPAVLFFNAHFKKLTPSVMIEKRVPGITIGKVNVSTEKRNLIYENAGQILKKIHAAKIKGFGPLQVLKGKLSGKYSSWEKYWFSKDNYLTINTLFLKKKKMIDTEEFKKIMKIYKFVGNQTIPTPSILHRDYQGGNILLSRNKVSGVIDFSLAISGDPIYDLSYSLLFQKVQDQKNFIKGYITDKDIYKIVKLYWIIIIVDKVAWRVKSNLPYKGRENILFLKKSLSKLNI